jgi:hypothetical protein
MVFARVCAFHLYTVWRLISRKLLSDKDLRTTAVNPCIISTYNK